jgi:L-arabinonolactonase
MRCDLLLDCRNELGESVLWDSDSGSLWWVNIHQREIWQLRDKIPKIYRLPSRVGAIALRVKGGLVVGAEKEFAFFDPVSNAYNSIAGVEPDLPMTRLNDGRCDRNGRFLCGGMSENPDAPACSNVYSLDPAGKVRTLISNVTCSNSICFSPSGSTMYFSDMPTGEIVAYDYDQDTGEISHRRMVCEASSASGLPDGSVVDADGCIWNARWGAGKVIRYTPTGKVDLTFEFPVTNVSCVGFGGPDFKTLFVTTAQFGLTADQLKAEPHAGSLFVIEPGVQGLPEPRYLG